MSITPAFIDALVAAGLTPEQMAAVLKAALQGDVELDGRVISAELREFVIARDGPRCVYCQGITATPQLDHVLPWSRGGQTTASNLVVACKACNSAKKNRTPEEWTCE